MRRPWGLLLGTCVTLGACAPASQLEPAGIAPVRTPFAVVPPAPPLPPAPPQFLPCPPGWLERETNPVVCAPWPNDAAEPCGAAEAHFVGDPHCSAIGAACPAGEWPDSFTAGRTVRFVSSQATTNGTGTRDAPFNTVSAAFAGATPGLIIALGKGTHVIDEVVPGGVTLEGACAAMTTVTRSATGAPRVELYVKAAGVEVKHLRVQGSGVGLQVEGALATVDVSGVLFDGVSGYGISAVRGGRAVLHDVVIRNTAPLSVVPGRGLEIALAGVVEGTRVIVDGSPEVGVHVTGAGSRATLTDSAITNSGGGSSLTGYGARVEVGGTAQFTRVMVAGNQDEGVSASDGVITLTDVVVRDTRPNVTNGRFGDGLAVHGGSITGTRVRLDANSHSGAVAVGSTSRITLVDASISDTKVDRLNLGLGVLVSAGGQLSVTRGVLRRTSALGAGAADPGSRLTLDDVVVEDTRIAPTRTSAAASGGDGIGARDGASLTLHRVAVRRAHSFGIELAGPGASLEGTDVDVSDTLEGFDSGGLGLGAFDAVLTVERLALHRNVATGLYLQGTSAFATDVRVDDTLADSQRQGGANVVVTTGATLSGERVTLQGGQVAGLLVNGAGASATLAEVEISGARLTCADPGCAGSVAMGAASLEGAALSLTRFRISDNAGIGVLQGTGDAVDLVHGEVSFHVIGAVSLDAQFDAARLAGDVSYVSNEQKLSAQTVPLPKVPQFTK